MLRTFYACSVARTKRFVTDRLTGQDSVRQQTQRQKRCPRLCPPFGHKGYQPGIQTERDARSVWFTGRLAAHRAVVTRPLNPTEDTLRGVQMSRSVAGLAPPCGNMTDTPRP